MNFKEFIGNLHEDERGQDLLEYALVLVTILVAVVAGSDAVANVISNALGTLSGRIANTVS